MQKPLFPLEILHHIIQSWSPKYNTARSPAIWKTTDSGGISSNIQIVLPWYMNCALFQKSNNLIEDLAPKFLHLTKINNINQIQSLVSSLLRQVGFMRRPSRVLLEQSEKLLTQALRGMVNLESFTWDRWAPVVVAQDDEGVNEDVWTVLKNKAQLRKLTVYDLRDDLLFPETRSTFKNQDLSLRISEWTYWSDRDGFACVDITSTIDTVNWPCIQHLALIGIAVNGSRTSMAKFLRRHPTLVTLKAYKGIGWSPGTMPFRIFGLSEETKLLPNIEEINLPWVTLTSLLPHLANPSQIRSLGRIYPDDRCSKPYLKIAEMPNLTELWASKLSTFAELEVMIALTPCLEVLHSSEISEHLLSPEWPHEGWLPYLSKWPHLREFHGIQVFGPVAGSRFLPRRVLQDITTACPNLQIAGGLRIDAIKPECSPGFIDLTA
ncbi:hypothetical protein ONZ45_g6939 [Pleurotus djamor]|nr:hypothetical protein ONZ45_g6939 [Pleurotus djamor]